MASRSSLYHAAVSNRQMVTNESTSNNEDCKSQGEFFEHMSPGNMSCYMSNTGSLSSSSGGRANQPLGQRSCLGIDSSSPIVKTQKFSLDISPMNTLSPVSSLAFDLNSTNLSERKNISNLGESFVLRSTPQCGLTPTRRRSLYNNGSFINNSSSDPSSDLNSISTKSFPPNFIRRQSNLSCSMSESIQESAAAVLGDDFEPLSSPSPTSRSPCKTSIVRDKENCLQGTPKDKLMTTARRRRRSPLKSIGNLGGVSRSLCFSSPLKKAPTPAKKQRQRASEPLLETSPLDEPDPNSMDSGYSASATKSDEARLRDTVSVAPRKLNLDTPTKSKSIRFQSRNSENQPPNFAINNVLSTQKKLKPLLSSESNIKLSNVCTLHNVSSGQTVPNNFTNSSTENKNDKMSMMSSLESNNSEANVLSFQRQSSNVALLPYLPSFFTETSSLVQLSQESDEDLCMHELYSLEEANESEVSLRQSSSPQMELGALLSGQVKDTSLLSSCSGTFELNKSCSMLDTLQTSATIGVGNDSQASSDDESEKIRATTKKLFCDDDNVCLESSSESTPLSRRDTEILTPRDSVESSPPASTEADVSMACTPSPGVVKETKCVQRIRDVLCTDMEVSPFNRNARPLIRRTLSLCDVTPPGLVLPRSALSPNQAFKRPLPPSEASPFVETKRPKTYVGTPRLTETFTLPCLKPLPMSAFNASPSQETATRTDGSSSPPSLECQQSDASPELPVSRTAAPEKSRLIPRSESSYSLVTRQSSVPVTSSDSIDASIVRETPLCKTLSESHLSIMKALNKCHNREEELTGDFCRSLSLPVISCGRNPDIKSITPETVAQLIHGEYSHLIESYQILDCRYPYEFEGGHIKGAESWHNPQFVVDYIDKAERVMPPTPTDPNKRHILIFHCEFSAERGPKAQRLLRERDRTVNKDRYPALHFPETYLLEGGYKAFFELYPSLCVPQKYTKMLDTNHAEDLKLCRARSKSWAVENKHGKGRSGLWSKRFNRDT
ncbi:uncharacterized protein LOC108669534 [Hyalella azteca]|uniref:protein-tyrosine-phosphatase n=1 Tax=Hyalella azteca TaxID=294128 RepID=A0A8B7NFH8_HYAAZ|nr:uncharacterized protein LOC108669534 [Hyalella azteca]